MIEEIICTPMFLDNVTQTMIRRTMLKVARDGEAEQGDDIEVKFLGMTHDSDGWPMKKWAVRIHKAR